MMPHMSIPIVAVRIVKHMVDYGTSLFAKVDRFALFLMPLMTLKTASIFQSMYLGGAMTHFIIGLKI